MEPAASHWSVESGRRWSANVASDARARVARKAPGACPASEDAPDRMVIIVRERLCAAFARRVPRSWEVDVMTGSCVRGLVVVIFRTSFVLA